jgi:hypothetical protein
MNAQQLHRVDKEVVVLPLQEQKYSDSLSKSTECYMEASSPPFHVMINQGEILRWTVLLKRNALPNEHCRPLSFSEACLQVPHLKSLHSSLPLGPYEPRCKD